MAAFGGDFAVGPYEMTFNGTSVGLLEGEIRHQQNVIGLPIRAGLYGQTIIDYILQGAGVFLVCTLKEWNAGSKAAMWQYGSTQGIVNEAGLLMSASHAKQIVLTALSGTPAATEGPVTRTYPLAMLLPGHNLEIPMGAVERNVQLVFGVLPEPESAGSKKAKFFTDT
jgi:hypothetical protein